MSGRSLDLRCLVEAAPERVFAALTRPGELSAWWGPHGFSTPEVDLDLRVGGAYRFTMQPPEGDAFHLGGEFLEIEPPTRLVSTFRWEEPTPDDRETIVALTLTPVGDTTEVRLLQAGFATDERLALHRRGWRDAFEKLRALLGRGGPGATAGAIAPPGPR